MTYIPPLNGKRISIKADSNTAIETGVVTLASGSNVTLGQSGSTITIDSTASGGLAGDIAAVGTIQMYAGSSAPTGWHICDGSAVSRATYADLFAVIGTTYGSGDGSTTFNLPNFKGSVPTGYDSGQTEFNALGKTGGEKTHQLTIGEMPSHTHTQNSHNHTQNSHNHTQDAHTHTQNAHTHTQNAHTHTQNAHSHAISPSGISMVVTGGGVYSVANGGFYGFQDGSYGSATATNQNTTATNQNTTATNQNTTATNQATTATNNAATATNQSTGGDGSHNILQPYTTVNFIIKIVSSAVGDGEDTSVVSITTKTSNYSLSTSDMAILADATSGNVTITLPLAGDTAGQMFYVKRIDNSANTVSIACSGSDTVDGAASVTIANQWTVTGVVSDGTNWYVI